MVKLFPKKLFQFITGGGGQGLGLDMGSETDTMTISATTSQSTGTETDAMTHSEVVTLPQGTETDTMAASASGSATFPQGTETDTMTFNMDHTRNTGSETDSFSSGATADLSQYTTTATAVTVDTPAWTTPTNAQGAINGTLATQISGSTGDTSWDATLRCAGLVLPFSNLVTNGDFELYTTSPGAPNNWLATGSPTLTRETTLIHGGLNSVKIVGTSGQGIQTDVHMFPPSGVMTFAFWARGGSGSEQIRITLFNNTDSTSESHDYTLTTTFTSYSFTTTVPGAGKQYDARVTLLGTHTVYLDDITFSNLEGFIKTSLKIRAVHKWDLTMTGAVAGTLDVTFQIVLRDNANVQISILKTMTASGTPGTQSTLLTEDFDITGVVTDTQLSAGVEVDFRSFTTGAFVSAVAGNTQWDVDACHLVATYSRSGIS